MERGRPAIHSHYFVRMNKSMLFGDEENNRE